MIAYLSIKEKIQIQKMPPIREHDIVFDDVEDEDGMPPLVDNPIPSMTYTFFTDMTPMSFTNATDSTDSPATSNSTNTAHELSPESSTSFISTPPASPIFPDDGIIMNSSSSNPRGSHGKKRDASYIPRPPNAFILFRSSFIRSQQVPGKVEGNHSTLSKIIGMYWKTLPREEREQWEAKAVVAQAEHRKRYPDWRFRPGANAMAKLKVKDGGTGTSKRRSIQSRKDSAAAAAAAGPDKGKGKGKSKEKRCAKIADLLVEGKKGLDLEVAVKEWEGDRRSAREKWRAAKLLREEEAEKDGEDVAVGGSGSGTEVDIVEMLDVPGGGVENWAEKESVLTSDADDEISDGTEIEDSVVPTSAISDSLGHDHDINVVVEKIAEEGMKTRSKTPDRSFDTNPLKVPLTHMFKRSLSAPASHSRSPYPPSTVVPRPTSPTSPTSPTHTITPQGIFHQTHIRRDTISFPMNASDYHPQLTWQEAEDRRRYEDAQGHGYWWTAPGESRETLWEEEMEESSNLSTDGLGYEDTGDHRFDQSYMDQFQSGIEQPPIPRDGSHVVNWTTNPGRHGLVAAIQDPYMSTQKCDHPPTPSTSPTSLSIRSSTNISTSPSTIAAVTTTPSTSPNLQPTYFYPSPPTSSFSTLSGWAGDFDGGFNTENSPSGWYQGHGWDNQLQPLNLQGSGEWDHMDLAVGSRGMGGGEGFRFRFPGQMGGSRQFSNLLVDSSVYESPNQNQNADANAMELQHTKSVPSSDN